MAVLAISAAGLLYHVALSDDHVARAGPSGTLPTAPASTDPMTGFSTQFRATRDLTVLDTFPADAVSVPWRLDSVKAGGRQLAISYYGGDGYCEYPAGIEVRETVTEVEITAASHVRPDQDACPGSLEIASGLVHLRHPLGARPLLHAPSQPKTMDGLP